MLLAALLVLGLCGCGSEKAMAKTASGSSPTVSQIMEDASKSGEGADDTKEAAAAKDETTAAEKEPEASDPARDRSALLPDLFDPFDPVVLVHIDDPVREGVRQDAAVSGDDHGLAAHF